MVKKTAVIVLVLVLVAVVGVVVIAGQEKTKKVDMELVGTVIDIGEGSIIFEVDLKGSPGKAYARGVSVSGLPTEMGDECFDLEGPDGMNTEYAQIAIIFEDGSMLFGNMEDKDVVPSYVCFASPSQAAYTIEGGTGRFEGADGDIVFELITYAFGEGLVIAETGHGTGEITLP